MLRTSFIHLNFGPPRCSLAGGAAGNVALQSVPVAETSDASFLALSGCQVDCVDEVEAVQLHRRVLELGATCTVKGFLQCGYMVVYCTPIPFELGSY